MKSQSIWQGVVMLLLSVTLIGCNADVSPQQGIPEDVGPRLNYDDTMDAEWEPMTLTTAQGELSLEYPSNWQVQRTSQRQIVFANGDQLIGRYAQGNLTEPLFAEDEVIIDVLFVERERILAGNDDANLDDDATALDILETIFEALPPLRNAGITPREIQINGILGAEETFDLRFWEYSVLVMQVDDDYFANVIVANASGEYDDTWDNVAERFVESFTFTSTATD